MEVKLKEKEISNKEKKMVALEISNELYQKVRKEAFDREVSLSAIVRFIVEKYFLERENNEDIC